MSPLELRNELEAEQVWRLDELRRLRNALATTDDERAKQSLRRALLVMLYAHYEGYVKFALTAYVRAVNSESMACSDAAIPVVAASWSKLFYSMESGEKKSKQFQKQLPAEGGLHRFARRIEFVERLEEFRERPAMLSDDCIDVESNLWPVVLKKNLYLLGLPFDVLDEYSGDIFNLVNRRNSICHGDDPRDVDEEVLGRMEAAAGRVIDGVMRVVFEAFSARVYVRPAAFTA